MTYPSYSTRYQKTTCTGGLLHDGLEPHLRDLEDLSAGAYTNRDAVGVGDVAVLHAEDTEEAEEDDVSSIPA